MATAVQVESIWNGLTDNSGQPLAAGKVYTFAAGTSTPVSLYTSSDKSTSATNPLILDGNGKAQVWADGRYKFVVKTAADVTLYTLDNLLYGFDDTTVLLGGISTGSANAQVVSVPATVESYANGQRITFIAGFTNSGATTLQFNALAAISIVKGPTPSSLQAGDLLAGQLYSCTYYGGSFYLENSPTPADVQRSRALLVTGISGSNTITGALTPALTSYEVGQVFRFKATGANTSAVTININGLGAKAVQRYGAALVAGEIQNNDMVEVVYDGTQFQLVNAVPAPLFIDRTNNRVGIGTTAPTEALQVSAGNAYVNGGKLYLNRANAIAATTHGSIDLMIDGSTHANLVCPASGSFAIHTGGAERMRFNSSGYVGVGTNNPLVLLDVYSTSSTVPQLAVRGLTTGSGGSSKASVQLDVSGNGGWLIENNSTGGTRTFTISDNNGYGSGTVERMRIDNAGKVFINTTTSVVGGQQAVYSTNAATSAIVAHVAANTGVAALVCSKQDNVATTAQDYVYFVYNNGAGGNGKINGNGAGQAAFGTYSDERLKENIQDLPSQLANIFALRPVEFDYKDGSGHQIGFIAQEIQDIFPDVVAEDSKGFLTITGMGKNEARMIKAFQEFAQLTQAKIDSLEARIAALEA